MCILHTLGTGFTLHILIQTFLGSEASPIELLSVSPYSSCTYKIVNIIFHIATATTRGGLCCLCWCLLLQTLGTASLLHQETSSEQKARGNRSRRRGDGRTCCTHVSPSSRVNYSSFKSFLAFLPSLFTNFYVLHEYICRRHTPSQEAVEDPPVLSGTGS